MNSPEDRGHDGESGDRRYLLEARVRNHALLKALRDIGHSPGSFEKAHEFRSHEVHRLVNMTASPFVLKPPVHGGRDWVPDESEYTAAALKIMLETKQPFDALFNEQQALYPLTRNFAERAVSEKDIRNLFESLPITAISGFEDAEPIESEMDRASLRQAMTRVVGTLTEREQKVIKLRFFDELSLGEVGATEGVSRERIRQIEAKALRKLRHPGRNSALHEFAYDGDGSADDASPYKGVAHLFCDLQLFRTLHREKSPDSDKCALIEDVARAVSNGRLNDALWIWPKCKDDSRLWQRLRNGLVRLIDSAGSPVDAKDIAMDKLVIELYAFRQSLLDQEILRGANSVGHILNSVLFGYRLVEDEFGYLRSICAELPKPAQHQRRLDSLRQQYDAYIEMDSAQELPSEDAAFVDTLDSMTP